MSSVSETRPGPVLKTPPPQTHRGLTPRAKASRIGGRTALYLILLAGGILSIAPFVWMFSASFEHIGDIFRWPPKWIPVNPTLENYRTFLQGENIARIFFNSFFVAVSVTALQMFYSSLAAYTFAKRRFPGRDAIFLLILGSMMIPGQVTLIPNYLVLKHIPLFGYNDISGNGGHGWLDSYWGLIIPGAFSAFSVFLMRQYIKTIPDELLDAARIDGASEFRIYWQVIIPLIRPVLAAVGIFTFTYVWDDFFWPLIIISDPHLYTLPLALALFVKQHQTNWPLLFAGSTLLTLPVLAIFLLFQRQFIRGIAVTGLK
jgi:multiple sugar transport system permease protein